MVKAFAYSINVSIADNLLGHILVQKYCDHLPLYRQNQIFEREDIILSTSTLCDWVSSCATLLEPIAQKIKDYVFAANQIDLSTVFRTDQYYVERNVETLNDS
jgi:transposase